MRFHSDDEVRLPKHHHHYPSAIWSVPHLHAVTNRAVDEQIKSRTSSRWVAIVDFGPVSVVAGLAFWRTFWSTRLIGSLETLFS
jgi:hypothetical protein